MEIIYKSVSFTQLLRVWTSRIIIIFFIILASLHIKENISGIVILIAILLIVALILKTDRIIVFEDNITWEKLYLFNLYNYKQVFLFNDIQLVESSKIELQDEMIELIFKKEQNSYLWIHLLSEKIITIKTTIKRKKLIKIADIVNNLIEKNKKG